MSIKDKFGFISFTENDLLEELYKDPDIDLSRFDLYGDNSGILAHELYKNALQDHYETDVAPQPIGGRFDNDTPAQVHGRLQKTWFMPEEYHDMDIAKWVLDQCQTDDELQRVGKELMLFQERNMIDLLRYLKYFVDTMRANNKVWGVGRGSSVASYVLFLIGVHKIDSIYYELSIKEFLRDE